MGSFVLDENLPDLLAQALREHGHAATTVREAGLGGAPDDRVLAFAHELRAALITADLDLADLTVFPLGTHSGIVVLRLGDATPTSVTSRVVEVLDREPDLAGGLLIIRPSRIRIRRP